MEGGDIAISFFVARIFSGCVVGLTCVGIRLGLFSWRPETARRIQSGAASAGASGGSSGG